jgi:hypothetical protein
VVGLDANAAVRDKRRLCAVWYSALGGADETPLT